MYLRKVEPVPKFHAKITSHQKKINFLVKLKYCSSLWPFRETYPVEDRLPPPPSDYFFCLFPTDMAGASLDKIHKKILLEKKFPEHATNLNSLPIYKWCQLILDGPTDHPLLMAFAIKFFKYFSAKSHVNPENAARVGHYFFEGVINTHYFGRIVTKFKTIEDHYQGLEDENCNVFFFSFSRRKKNCLGNFNLMKRYIFLLFSSWWPDFDEKF